MKIALLLVAGSDKQNHCFWPSYRNAAPGVPHDLIVVHRNMSHVPTVIMPEHGKVVFENKIAPTGELPHKAFGAYRNYFGKYKNEYDAFAFISDDVVIKSDGWLKKATDLLQVHPKLGFVGTQIFNGGHGKYPHPSHCRAPAWFSRSDALSQIDWQFDSDHDGEMKLAQQFKQKGFFGAQVGNKIDVAYDALENGGCHLGDHITSILERWATGRDDLRAKLSADEIQSINGRLLGYLERREDYAIVSPYSHIGQRNVVKDLEPFHGLLFDETLEAAKACNCAEEKAHNIWLLKGR